MVGWDLVRASLALRVVAVLTGVRRGAAGVAGGLLCHGHAFARGVRHDVVARVTASFEGRLGGSAGSRVSTNHREDVALGAVDDASGLASEGAGGTEADDKGDSEEGEFRFHGWIWLDAVLCVHAVQLHAPTNPSGFLQNISRG